jgi:hypothetical protein
LIRAEDVAAGYRGQPVLEDVELYIRDGEFTAVSRAERLREDYAAEDACRPPETPQGRRLR